MREIRLTCVFFDFAGWTDRQSDHAARPQTEAPLASPFDDPAAKSNDAPQPSKAITPSKTPELPEDLPGGLGAIKANGGQYAVSHEAPTHVRPLSEPSDAPAVSAPYHESPVTHGAAAVGPVGAAASNHDVPVFPAVQMRAEVAYPDGPTGWGGTGASHEVTQGDLFDQAPASGFAVSISGIAMAVGNHTSTDGVVFSQLVDHGPVAYAFGYAEFHAVSRSDGDGESVAQTFTEVNAIGADLVIEMSHSFYLSDGETAYSVSKTQYLVVDYDFWDPPGGTIEVSLSSHMGISFLSDAEIAARLSEMGSPDTDFPPQLSPLDTLFEVSGNDAHGTSVAVAQGDHTYSDAETVTLVIENAFSSIGASATTAIA